MSAVRRGQKRREEQGAVAIMVTLLAISLLILLAFTTDFGVAYAQRQAIGTGADSAALAIVRNAYADQLKNPSRTCAQIVAADSALTPTAPTKSTNVALTQVNANAPFHGTLTASDLSVSLSCVQSGNVLQASVGVTRKVPRIFGKVAGSAPVTISRHSVADLGTPNSVTGVEPIGLCKLQAQKITSDAAQDLASGVPFRAELISVSQVWGANGTCDGSGGSGNWGWLDLGQGTGDSQLAAMIASGSTNPLILTSSPLSLGGTPGNKGNSNGVHDAMQTIMGRQVVLPIYDTYSGNGNNATYNVTGFLTVQMCAYDKTVTSTCYDPSVPMQGDDMQVKFVAYAPIGNIGGTCGIGACAGDSLVTQLVK